jgi:hypothetical protein
MKGAQAMQMKPVRKTPQQIRAATEELAKKHQANFSGWLDARKAAIDVQKTEELRHLSIGLNREIIK